MSGDAGRVMDRSGSQFALGSHPQRTQGRAANSKVLTPLLTPTTREAKAVRSDLVRSQVRTPCARGMA